MRELINTLIESRADMLADVAAINAGDALRDGDLFTIHGRQYRMKANGTLFPVDGPGFHVLSRRAHKALTIYNKYGLTVEAERLLSLDADLVIGGAILLTPSTAQDRDSQQVAQFAWCV